VRWEWDLDWQQGGIGFVDEWQSISLGLSVVFLVVAVPFGSQLGGFGILWSIALALILGYNVWQYLIRNRSRW
jgi:hypothetical protein